MARSSSLALLITPPEEPSDWLRLLKDEDFGWLFDEADQTVSDLSPQALVDANVELAEVFSDIVRLCLSKALYNIRNNESTLSVIDDVSHVGKASGKLLRGTKSRLFREKERELLSKLEYTRQNRKLRDCWEGLIDLSKSALTVIRIVIDNDSTDDLSNISLQDRLRMLDEFVAKFPGVAISQYASKIFPELKGDILVQVAQAIALGSDDEQPNSTRHGVPEVAPKLWSEREAGQTPPGFVRAHYGIWRDGVWDSLGLTKADLRRLDRQCYQALATWETRHPEDGLNLPTRAEISVRGPKVTASWVAAIGEDNPRAKARALEREAKSIRRGLDKA